MVSIGIPAFKPQYLREAIESVLNQTFRDFELIISNGGSQDAIRHIVASFTDPRIRYTEVGNIPVVDHWNLVLSKACGEFFVLFSDDDLYEAQFLERMIALAGEYPECPVFHCRVRRIDASGRELLITPECPAYESGLEFILGRIRGKRSLFAADFMCRTSILKASGGFVSMPGAWGTDDLTWFRMALQGGIAYTPEVLFSWRTSPSQISSSMPVATRLEAVGLYRESTERLLAAHQPYRMEDQELVERIYRSMEFGIRNQKNYLMLHHAGTSDIWQHILFFRRNRRRFGLSFRGFIYSLMHRSKKIIP